MAWIENYETGEEITAGLQGCKVCDEAAIAARSISENLQITVVLHDDDGAWLVVPGTNELTEIEEG